MGLMRDIEPGRLVVTPHPVLLDGQTNVEADLRPGESLYTFLSRHVDLSEQWEVRIGGVVVPVEMWSRIYPKHGQVIECHGAVNRQAVALVAMVALTYFTFGAGSIVGLGGAYAGAGAYVAATGLYMAGSMLINKVLTPELPKPKADNRDSVYSIGAARNAARPYEPIALLLGHTRITPDYASAPYTWYEGDDMCLGMVLNVGINVQDVGEIYNADTVLTSYEGVQVYYHNIPGKPQQNIPLYSNADTIDGGALDKDTTWVQRTTPADTVRVQVNIEGSIGDKDSKGRDYPNSETIEAQYRPVGSTSWIPLTSRLISNANDKNFEVQRVTMSRDLPRGQYEVRVRRLFTAGDPDKGNWSAASEFQWTNMVAVQADEADYAGMGRIGIRVKATGQLTGAMDQLRLEAWSKPVPVWTGSAWVTESTSNPGALALQFLRGIEDENGKLIAGVGLTDAEIDIPSLQAFMLHCATEGYTYDHYLTETRSNGDQLDAILRAGFGALSSETGKLGVVWAAAGQPVSGVVNMATIKKGQFQVDYTLSQAADGIEATYFDRTDWSVKTLRVAAPGVTTMLNPAQVQLEGVTSEDHAAQLARWHLAQSLYQYKDITYSTDLEHLAYKRMDVLQLQHDLTQWGYGGRLVSVSGSTVTLDEPVPPSATAHIGIRVPGEKVYRIMRVANFTGEPRDTVTLLDAWPADAPLPNQPNDQGIASPEHDYIWIYDFKATPGYRVRVVGKTLESDAKGASVAVVPESPEFWTYVKTGEYTPPKGGSLLNTLPKASNVRVSEVQVVTGDVIHTELSVLFDIKGQAARSVIFAGISGTEIRPVAETVTNQVRFRIGSAGTYTILVRPYSVDGIAGEAASTTYTTTGADIPPPPFDWFTVTVEPGGLRRYAWGYNQFQPADLAGAEIRFSAEEGTPAWEAMTPIGEDGFFTSAFESDVPASGDWTFAIRARNTSGELSSAVYVRETLTHNVGENITDHEDRITTTEQLAQEILSDFAAMNQQIADVQAEAQQAAAALNLRADQLRADIDATMAQVNDILGAGEWEVDVEYSEGDLVTFDGKLYRATQDVPIGTPVSDTTYWELMGEYASLGEAVAAHSSQLAAHASELLAQAESLNLLGAKNGAGTAFLLDEDTVRVSPTETLAQWRASLQAAFGDANARIDAEETARADADAAQVGRISTMEARMPSGTGGLATAASVTAEATARSNADSAQVSRIEAMEARMPTGTGGLATAQALQQTTNRVSTVEGTVSAHTQQISDNSAAIAGKANSSTVTALSNTVTQQGNTLTAHGTQLSGLSASVGDNEASINELREVSVSAAAGNSVVNPSFESGTGWVFSANAVRTTSSNTGSGDWILRLDPGATGVNNEGRLVLAAIPSFRVGAKLRWGATPNAGSAVRVVVHFYRADGSYLNSTLLDVERNSLGTSFQVFSWRLTPLAGAYSASVSLSTRDLTSGSYAVDDVFLEPVGQTLADVLARYTLAVQAGGDIAGIQLLAGGGISAFRILASMFQIVDPGGTGGYTHSAGVSVWRIGSAMIAIGPGFGAGNEFVFWAGPNQSNLNNCTRANAGMYFTRTNDAYFGGTLTAGALYHPSQATFTAYPLNVQAEVGPFVSQGGTKRVSSQFRYNNSGTVPGNVTSGHGQTFNGTVTIYRRIGTGSWTQVNSYPITGVKSAIYQSELNRTVVVTVINGAIAYNDTNTSTQDFSYRARVTAFADPGVAGIPIDGEVTIASKEG